MPEADCLFCRVVRKELPSRVVHEDPLIVAFEDIHPQAPTHILVVPRAHLETLNDLLPEHEPLIGHMVAVAAQLAKARGIAASGYRTLFNCNRGAGQTVYHVHLHLLGGRSFGWPPG
jgi:histidine triad (HIT) family protein